MTSKSHTSHKQVSLLATSIAVLICASVVVPSHALKTYLLVGLGGTGKSTIANCLINKNPDLYHIRDYPFNTSNSASGCTNKFQVCYDEHTRVIDTIGFGDPELNQTSVLNSLREALDSENYLVDAIIFVIREGRFLDGAVDFFELIQKNLLCGKARHNSLLICNGCPPGWLAAERTKSPYLSEALANCNNLGFEFELCLDEPPAQLAAHPSRMYSTIATIFKSQRNASIARLNAFLDKQHFKKIDLTFVNSEKFRKQYLERAERRMKRVKNSLLVTSVVTLSLVGLVSTPTAGGMLGMQACGIIHGLSRVTAGISFTLFHAIDFVNRFAKRNMSRLRR